MFRTINAISDNVSTGGRHPRRSSDMQPPPQPSVTDFPIGRKKRKDKAPATPRSQDSSRERPKDTASDTQQTISQGPAPKHEPVRRSEPGRRSTFGYPALPVTEGDSQEPTMVPHDPADIYDVIVGSCRLQSLRNKNVLSAKITHSEFTFITIVQNETEDEFELYLGRESPLEEFQVPVCTDDDLLELATSNTAFLRSLAIELMKFAAACAPILDANIDAITKEAHEAAVNRLRLRITKAEAKLSWYEKEVSKLTETIETTNAELEHTNRERNELKLEVERFYRPSSSKTAGCTNPTHQDWYEDWKHEEAQSIKFHGLYEEFFRKHQEERARADRYHQQRAERDADYEDVVAQNCALEEQLVQATENTRKLETSLTQQQREYNDVVARLQRYDHNFRPYTLQRREDRGRNSHLSTQRNRRHESPERRTDRRTASPNPYPSRQATPVVTRPAPRPRGDSHSRSRSRSRRDRANPLNQDPHRYIPPPYNGQQSVQQAASTVGGLSLSFKLPDIEVWKGNDDTKNYDKWRRSAIQKCESLPEDKQLAYLEMKVDGAAWQYIDDLKFEHYLDLLEGLDPYYARSTYEKVSEAQSQLADGSLKMGSSESFADWRGRFMSVCRLVKLPDSAMIGYARAFLRPGLAAAASHAFDDEQENALVKFLDAARKSDLTQKQINQGKTAADKPRTKPRTRSPNDRNPARKARSGRGQHREATTTRTEWQKDAMAKAKVCFRCGETGHQARDKKGCAILDWDQIKPKLSSMHLYAMGADFDAEDDDSNASTEEEPDRIQELDWRKDIQQNRETRENHNRLKVAAARILSPEVGDQDNSQDVQDHYISAIAVKGHLRSTKQLRYDSYTLTSSKEWKKTTTLIDTGASASFVNRRWAKAMGLPIMSTSSPIQLSLADGKVVDTLNEAVEIQVKHGSHLSPVVCFVADVGDFDLILGMTWLEDHDPGLTFSPRSMKFSSSHCTSCCLDHGLPETVYGDGKTPSLSESRQTTPVGEICIITAKAAYLMAAHNPDEAIWVEPQDWEKLADPPDDNNDCDLDSFKRNIARLAAVTQEDYDHYMNKMESPHMTEAEIRKLVPDWLYSKMPDLFTRVCTINIAKDGGSRHAVYLANLITQRTLPDSIPAVAQMLYQLSEEDNISERSLCAADNVTISPITTPIAATSAPAIPNETPAAINVPAPPNNELTIDALLDNIKAAYKDDKVLQAIVKAKKDGLRRLPFKLIHGEEHLRLELGDCEITDELLYVRNKVYVPAGAVRTQVIEQAHKSVCGGHSGKHELYSKLSRWYYWPRMTTDVAQYVRACLTCKRSKAYREGKHGLLHPLPIPSKYWSSISIDFITHLPPCRHNGQTFTDILVVVDRLTKKKKFIPMASMTTDALVVAFIEYIWREEGFPEEIISDRGAQFVSYFWKRLCQRLGVRPKFSTAHHPQTDGQTENANSYLKQYLRAYVNYEQDNWALFLPIAEFEANSSTSSTTGKSPFFATKGYNPRSGIEPPAPAPGAATLTAPAQQERLNADAFADRMKTLQDELRASMQWAQAKQAEYANEGRLPAPAFKVGDQVMLDTRNLRTKRPSASLDLKNRGPFTIVRAINNTAYELDLPANMKRIHNVFHPWLLHLVDDNPLTGQTQDPEVPAEFDPEVEDDTEYTVEAIEDCRINKKLKDPAARGRKGKTTQGLLQYLVRWANYPDGPDNPSWEPYMNLADSADTVTRYHLDHPNKPPMHRKFKSLTGKQDMLVMRLHALSRV
ncbi:rve multi-domain protein [Pyrenophora tritici-repentis]|uniref:Rve multi-domain protein n=1 Tax=Pyrenophora tritici-repentis TaxID=45151 RepID=A0A922SR52_9PLEO|nr:rve multi-domain protein [Pyrenophora tritici-repentis]